MSAVFKKNYDWRNSDCCCDIETLRKILRLFQGRNIEIFGFTRNSIFSGFVFDLAEDIVYISSTFGDQPNQFIPLCTVVSFSADIGSESLADEFREKILNLIHPTCTLNPCCCTDGIANTINSIEQTFPPTTLLDFRFDSTLPFLLIVETDLIVKATDDIVFIAIEDNLVFVLTCGIDSLSIPTTNGFSKQNQSFKNIFKEIKK